MPKIAISYRRTDSAQIAGRIRERLAAQYGKDSIFIDIYDIPLGSEFPRHVQQVWSETDVLLALIGPNWVRGEAHLWPAVALAYLGLPAFVLLVAHYVIVNALDLDTLYLRMAAFFIALPFSRADMFPTQKPSVIVTTYSMFGASPLCQKQVIHSTTPASPLEMTVSNPGFSSAGPSPQ
jgi:hypothetical protein